MKRSVLYAVAAAIAAGACDQAVTLPAPPRQAEVDAVAASYDNPTGTIDAANIAATLDGIEAQLAAMQVDLLPTLIAEELIRLARRIDDASLTSDTEDGADTAKHTQVDAVVDLTRVCRGWSDTAGLPDKTANGFVEMTGVVDDGVLRPDLWGGASACKTRLDGADASAISVTPSPSVNLSIDGTLDVRLYGPLPRSVGEAKFLLLFSGRLGTDDRTVDTSFDFRVLDGQLAFRYAVSDGEIIVEVGLTSLSLRGSNATFTCDLASRSCQ